MAYWHFVLTGCQEVKLVNSCDSAFTTRCSFNVYHGHAALQNSSGLLKTTIHKNMFFVRLKCMQYLYKTFPALLVANLLIKLASLEFKCYGGYIKVMCLGSRRLHGSDWSKKRRSGRWYVFQYIRALYWQWMGRELDNFNFPRRDKATTTLQVNWPSTDSQTLADVFKLGYMLLIQTG